MTSSRIATVHARLQGMLPLGVVASTRNIRGRAMRQDERAFAKGMGDRRAAEFLAGRACARFALKALGVMDQHVGKAASGAPIWPPDVVGSISHSEGLCVAVVARPRQASALGIDIESDRPLAEELDNLICCPDELASARRTSLCPKRASKALFSIKESVFKAYFPATGALLDMRDARVELDSKRGRFEASLTNNGMPSLRGHRRVQGAYAWLDGLILSLCHVA